MPADLMHRNDLDEFSDRLDARFAEIASILVEAAKEHASHVGRVSKITARDRRIVVIVELKAAD